jgi:hypothetical protein
MSPTGCIDVRARDVFSHFWGADGERRVCIPVATTGPDFLRNCYAPMKPTCVWLSVPNARTAGHARHVQTTKESRPQSGVAAGQ